MTILVTGGAGYIGSHVCYELIHHGYNVVVIDSLENSTIDSIRALEQNFNVKIPTYTEQVQADGVLDRIFTEHSIDAVIHMAGYKSVKESLKNPDAYYDNNLLSTIALLKGMDKHNCRRLIFSSSATVYGDADGECFETSSLSTLNPYGETKLMIERMLDYAVFFTPKRNDLSHIESAAKFVENQTKYQDIFNMSDIPNALTWSFISLRYFNPVGAHPSHIIGENPRGVPENLVPYVMKVMSGELEKLTIFGNDYDTPDGTAIRDYIHVVDLARAHVQALKHIESNDFKTGTHIRFNIGTGKGYSVLDVVRTFEEIIKNEDTKLPWEYGPRRGGDAARIYANADRARDILNWKPEYNLEAMCRDSWEWWKLKTISF